MKDYIIKVKEVFIEILRIILLTFLGLLFLSFSVAMVKYGFKDIGYLAKIDEYLKVILTAWPASFIIVMTILLFTQKNALDYFIKNRMTKLGFDGVSGDVLTSPASDGEMREKNVEDVKDESALQEAPDSEEVNSQLDGVTLESNVANKPPNTINESAYKKFKERERVEEIVQTVLIDNFGDRYKSQVKLSKKDGEKIILDGIIYSYSGQMRAVEIKYVKYAPQHSGLHFILSRLRDKLEGYGINKLIVIVVSENMDEELADKMREFVKAKVAMFFFKLTAEDTLEQIVSEINKKELF